MLVHIQTHTHTCKHTHTLAHVHLHAHSIESTTMDQRETETEHAKKGERKPYEYMEYIDIYATTPAQQIHAHEHAFLFQRTTHIDKATNSPLSLTQAPTLHIHVHKKYFIINANERVCVCCSGSLRDTRMPKRQSS